MLCCKIRILFQPKGSTFTEKNTLVYGPVEPCFNKWLRFLIWGDMLFSYDVKFQGSKFNPYQSIQNLWWNQPSVKGSNLIHKLVGSCHVTQKYVYIHICIQIFFRSLAKKTVHFADIVRLSCFCCCFFSLQRAETPKVTMTLIDNANQADGAKWSRVSCFNEGWSCFFYTQKLGGGNSKAFPVHP